MMRGAFEVLIGVAIVVLCDKRRRIPVSALSGRGPEGEVNDLFKWRGHGGALVDLGNGLSQSSLAPQSGQK